MSRVHSDAEGASVPSQPVSGGGSLAPLMVGRVYPQGRWWRFEAQFPSGGGWHSKGFYTEGGARRALKAAMKRRKDAIAKATGALA